MAREYGYRVDIRESEAPWKFDVEELAQRNTHGVPKEVIETKLKEWEHDITIEDVMAAEGTK